MPGVSVEKRNNTDRLFPSESAETPGRVVPVLCVSSANNALPTMCFIPMSRRFMVHFMHFPTVWNFWYYFPSLGGLFGGLLTTETHTHACQQHVIADGLQLLWRSFGSSSPLNSEREDLPGVVVKIRQVDMLIWRHEWLQYSKLWLMLFLVC